MRCTRCKGNISDLAKICPHCGQKVVKSKTQAMPARQPAQQYVQPQYEQQNAPAQHTCVKNDSKSFAYALLGFLFPAIGFILFLVWREDRPLRAKSCGKGALLCVVLEIVFVVLIYALAILAALGYIPSAPVEVPGIYY